MFAIVDRTVARRPEEPCCAPVECDFEDATWVYEPAGYVQQDPLMGTCATVRILCVRVHHIHFQFSKALGGISTGDTNLVRSSCPLAIDLSRATAPSRLGLSKAPEEKPPLRIVFDHSKCLAVSFGSLRPTLDASKKVSAGCG